MRWGGKTINLQLTTREDVHKRKFRDRLCDIVQKDKFYNLYLIEFAMLADKSNQMHGIPA